MIKLRGWELMVIQAIAIPVLKRVVAMLKLKVEETPEEWDDVLVGIFQTVIAFFEDPHIFEIKDK